MSPNTVSRWCWLLHSMLEMVNMYMDFVFCHTRTCSLYISAKVSLWDVPLYELSLTIDLLSAWYNLIHGDNEYPTTMASKVSQPKHTWCQWVSRHKGISIKTYIKIHDEYISHEIDAKILHHTSSRNRNNIVHLTANYQISTWQQHFIYLNFVAS